MQSASPYFLKDIAMEKYTLSQLPGTSEPPQAARIGNRMLNLFLVERLKRLGQTLKSNAAWMKQFLHGRK